jgi:uncharacterized protein (UPF0333 family)
MILSLLNNLSKKKKGQISMEFFVIFTIIILLFVFFSLFFFNRFLLLNNRAISFSAEEICETLSYSIDNVYFSEEGISTSVYLPAILKNNQNYSVFFYQNAVVISYGLREEFCPMVILSNSINGTFKISSWNKISKKKEGVVIENY